MKIIFISLLFLLIILISVSNFYIKKIEKPIGDKGEKGEIGTRGKPGESGKIGKKGEKGYGGFRGEKGKDIGLQGEQGPRGIQGMVGPEGDRGNKGIRGSEGKKGFKGMLGLKGKKGNKGMRGLQGNPRPVSKTEDINLIANKNKCIRIINEGNENDLMCPKNMAIFNIRTKKRSKFDLNHDIDNIICCEIKVGNDTIESYFRRDFNVLINLTLKLYNINEMISKDTNNQLLINYTAEQKKRMLDNYEKIMNIIKRINDFKSVREISRTNLMKLIGNNDHVDSIKEYTENEVYKINQHFDSITSYELYVIHLMSRLIRKKDRYFEASVDISDYVNLIKALYEFPKNNFEELEILNNVTYFENPDLYDSGNEVNTPSNTYEENNPAINNDNEIGVPSLTKEILFGQTVFSSYKSSYLLAMNDYYKDNTWYLNSDTTTLLSKNQKFSKFNDDIMSVKIEMSDIFNDGKKQNIRINKIEFINDKLNQIPFKINGSNILNFFTGYSDENINSEDMTIRVENANKDWFGYPLSSYPLLFNFNFSDDIIKLIISQNMNEEQVSLEFKLNFIENDNDAKHDWDINYEFEVNDKIHNIKFIKSDVTELNIDNINSFINSPDLPNIVFNNNVTIQDETFNNSKFYNLLYFKNGVTINDTDIFYNCEFYHKSGIIIYPNEELDSNSNESNIILSDYLFSGGPYILQPNTLFILPDSKYYSSPDLWTKNKWKFLSTYKSEIYTSDYWIKDSDNWDKNMLTKIENISRKTIWENKPDSIKKEETVNLSKIFSNKFGIKSNGIILNLSLVIQNDLNVKIKENDKYLKYNDTKFTKTSNKDEGTYFTLYKEKNSSFYYLVYNINHNIFTITKDSSYNLNKSLKEPNDDYYLFCFKDCDIIPEYNFEPIFNPSSPFVYSGDIIVIKNIVFNNHGTYSGYNRINNGINTWNGGSLDWNNGINARKKVVRWLDNSGDKFSHLISNEKLLAVTVEYDDTYSEIKGYSHLPSTIESIEGSKLESVKINDDTSKNYYSAFWIENYDAMTEKLGELFNWYDIFATNIPIEIYRKIDGDWSKIKTFNSVIDWRKDSDLHIKYFFKTKKYASNMNCNKVMIKSNTDDKCDNYIGISKNNDKINTYNFCKDNPSRDYKTVDLDENGDRIVKKYCQAGSEITNVPENKKKFWDDVRYNDLYYWAFGFKEINSDE